MDTASIYSKADVLRIANVPEDAFVFWERQDLIQGHQKGPRAHKRYSARELKFAALLGEARLTGMNVATMREMMAAIRHAFEYYDTLPKIKHVVDLIGDLNHRRFYLDGGETFGDPDLEADKTRYLSADFVADLIEKGWINREDELLYRSVQDTIDLDRTKEYWIARGIDDEDGHLAVYRDRSGTLRLEEVEGTDLKGTKSALTFYLNEIFSLAWPGAAELEAV